jgi:hypothetical protein
MDIRNHLFDLAASNDRTAVLPREGARQLAVSEALRTVATNASDELLGLLPTLLPAPTLELAPPHGNEAGTLQVWVLHTFDPIGGEKDDPTTCLVCTDVFASEAKAYESIRDMEREEVRDAPDSEPEHLAFEQIEVLIAGMRSNRGRGDVDLTQGGMLYVLEPMTINGSAPRR